MQKALTLSAVLLGGCAAMEPEDIARGMYSVPETGASEFDGSRYVRVKNIPCTGDAVIRLDLYQDTGLARDGRVIITAKVTGIRNISGGESLKFNINGEHVALASIDDSTATEEITPGHYSAGFVGYRTYVPPSYSSPSHVSTRRYTARESLVERLSAAEKAIVRVKLARHFIEASCGPPAATTSEVPNWFSDISAPAGFAKFIDLAAELD